MTQKFRWLAALALLLAFGASAVRAEDEEAPPPHPVVAQVRPTLVPLIVEEEEAPPPHPVVELLPPPHCGTAVSPNVRTAAMPMMPPGAWSVFPAPCPCPCPMPIVPIAAFGPYGQPCAAYPTCAALPPSCEPAVYMLALRVCKAGADGDQDVITSPRICVAEGQSGTVEVSGIVTPKEQSALHLNVAVTKHGDGAMLGLTMEDAHSLNRGEYNARTHTEAMEMRCHVTLGESTKMVLSENSDGSPRTWIEVTVTEVEQEQHAVKTACTGSCSAVRRCEAEDADECPLDAVSEIVQGVFDMVADAASGLFDMDTQADAFTAPTGQYLQSPPSYFPAEPAFPMARELAGQTACPSGAMGCGRAVSAHMVGQCECPAATCGSGCCQCGLVEMGKQMGTHLSIDASHDRKTVEMSDGKKHFKASADSIVMHDDCIDLQGDVRVESCDDSCNDSTVIKADKVHVERKDGGLKIQIDE